MAIEVGTFNAYQMGAFSKDNQQRFELLINYLGNQNFSIIGFQELWQTTEINTLKEKFGLHYNFSSGPISGEKNSSGLLIMSEYGLSEQEFINKNFNHFSGLFPAQKGIQKVKFSKDEKNIEFFNIHKAYPFKSNFYMKAKTQIPIQKKQQDILENSLSQKPTMIVGDFNTFENYQEVVPSGYNILSPTNESTRSPSNKYAHVGFNCPIIGPFISDLIMASEDFISIDSKIVKEPLMSDHYFVKATLE